MLKEKEYRCNKCGNYKLPKEFRRNFVERSNYTCSGCDNARRRKNPKTKEIRIIEDSTTKYFCTFCKVYHPEDEMYITEKGIKRRDLRCKTSTKSRAKEYRDNNMLKVLLANAKKRAFIKQIPFSITLSDIIIPKRCPILEIPIIIGASMEQRNNSPSLDRIDNDRGYIKGNIMVISNLANSIKRDLTKEQLLTFSKNIINYMT